jgi:hypothetical protein
MSSDSKRKTGYEQKDENEQSGGLRDWILRGYCIKNNSVQIATAADLIRDASRRKNAILERTSTQQPNYTSSTRQRLL